MTAKYKVDDIIRLKTSKQLFEEYEIMRDGGGDLPGGGYFNPKMHRYAGRSFRIEVIDSRRFSDNPRSVPTYYLKSTLEQEKVSIGHHYFTEDMMADGLEKTFLKLDKSLEFDEELL